MLNSGTVVAISTPPGSGAIAIIRISGDDSLLIAQNFIDVGDQKWKPNQSILGYFKVDNQEIDQVLSCYFKAPNSYTGEDLLEIYCHGSVYIQRKILESIVDWGVKVANAGEFTLRAYLNKKMDLAQAEAVGDLIASESEASHQVAISQLKGNFSSTLKSLRQELIEFKSLIELELDFSQEDVTFADRESLLNLIQKIRRKIVRLSRSFAIGNALKDGIPVTIVGRPNVGKSSLLNALLHDDKAIVTDVPGTTRDTIEDVLFFKGHKFRFIDTAGIRKTEDKIEAIGIERAFEKASKAQYILYLFDSLEQTIADITADLEIIVKPNIQLFAIENKIDRFGGLSNLESQKILDSFNTTKELLNKKFKSECFRISTFDSATIEQLKEILYEHVTNKKGNASEIITNIRHYKALKSALVSLDQVQKGIENQISSDLLSIDLNEVILHIGSITGTVEIDRDILGSIFGKFCIGK